MTTEGLTLTRASSTGDDDRPVAVKTVRAGAARSSLAGMLWFGGWLFTVGILQLIWWKAIVALLVWPYFLGSHFR
jgi:hypothetical protein